MTSMGMPHLPSLVLIVAYFMPELALQSTWRKVSKKNYSRYMTLTSNLFPKSHQISLLCENPTNIQPAVLEILCWRESQIDRQSMKRPGFTLQPVNLPSTQWKGIDPDISHIIQNSNERQQRRFIQSLKCTMDESGALQVHYRAQIAKPLTFHLLFSTKSLLVYYVPSYCWQLRFPLRLFL